MKKLFLLISHELDFFFFFFFLLELLDDFFFFFLFELLDDFFFFLLSDELLFLAFDFDPMQQQQQITAITIAQQQKIGA